MSDEVLEVMAQLYADEADRAQVIIHEQGSQSEDYSLTVGRRSGLLTLARKFNRYDDLVNRHYEIERERKGY